MCAADMVAVGLPARPICTMYASIIAPLLSSYRIAQLARMHAQIAHRACVCGGAPSECSSLPYISIYRCTSSLLLRGNVFYAALSDRRDFFLLVRLGRLARSLAPSNELAPVLATEEDFSGAVLWPPQNCVVARPCGRCGGRRREMIQCLDVEQCASASWVV